MIRIEVYTRSNCPLCDELGELLERARREHALVVEWIDIESSASLEEEYGHRIPVVKIEGRERFHGRVDPVLLRRALKAEARRRKPWWRW